MESDDSLSDDYRKKQNHAGSEKMKPQLKKDF